jgi:hypothetical protein
LAGRELFQAHVEYDAFPAISEVWTVSIPTVAFELIRPFGALKRVSHLLLRDLGGIVSPFELVRLLQDVFYFRHFCTPFHNSLQGILSIFLYFVNRPYPSFVTAWGVTNELRGLDLALLLPSLTHGKIAGWRKALRAP